MSMHVGLTNNGSDAQSLNSRPSATVKVDSAFSGGTWADAAKETSNRSANDARKRGHGIMVGDHSVERRGRRVAGRFGEEQYSGCEGRRWTKYYWSRDSRRRLDAGVLWN